MAVVADVARAAWEDYLKSVGAEFEHYVRELGRVNMAYARALQDLATTSSAHLKDVVDAAPTRRGEHGPRRTTVRRAGPSGGSAPDASPPHAELALDAQVGDSASGAFTVANPSDETAHLSFDASLLVDTSESSTSAAGFPPRFVFDPPSLELAPGSEATVSVTLALPARMFKAGHDYRGEVRVIGGDGAVLDVTVLARPGPARKKAASKTARAATKKAAAKRSVRAPRTPPRQG